ncbi:MAG: hypothetical protein ABIJ24_01160 [Nitrospinota bacterium]|nr:hypothetical protein [Nitrospinota bacterium]
MEIKQFEHLESKIIALVEFVERQKKEQAELYVKIKGLEEQLVSMADNSRDIAALRRENSQLQKDIDRLNKERILVKGKAEVLLGQVEKMEAELIWTR